MAGLDVFLEMFGQPVGDVAPDGRQMTPPHLQALEQMGLVEPAVTPSQELRRKIGGALRGFSQGVLADPKANFGRAVLNGLGGTGAGVAAERDVMDDGRRKRAKQLLDVALGLAKGQPDMPASMAEFQAAQDNPAYGDWLEKRNAKPPPAFIQEFQEARRQGFKGNIVDYRKTLQPGSSLRTIQVDGEVRTFDPETGAVGPSLGKADVKKPNLRTVEVNGEVRTFNPETGEAGPALGRASNREQAAPSGYRYAADGTTLEAIPGGPATKMPAEVAGRVAMLDTASQGMDEAEKFFLDPKNSMAGEAWGNLTNSGDYGRAKRTVRMAIEAGLRAMTGAAAPESEVKSYENMFLPLPIDTIKTREQKLGALRDFMVQAKSIMEQGRGTTPDVGAGGGDEGQNFNINDLNDADEIEEELKRRQGQ